MTQANRRALTLTALAITLGVAIAIFEPHRLALQAIVPALQDFWFTFIAI
jgi:hypothetical protein